MSEELVLIKPLPGQKVWLVSDTHYDHTNIIRYCNRPFDSVREMNNELVKNWNEAVRNDDLVLVLGDVSTGRGNRGASYWLSKLRGRKVLIRANHDKGRIHGCEAVIETGAILDYEGEEFLLVHRPYDLLGIGGWRIHGHIHDKGSLINVEKKAINVSVEQIGYTPISMTELLIKRKAKLWECRIERLL